MGQSRRRKKKFECDHVGFGKYCHKCFAEKGEKLGLKSGGPSSVE